MPAYWAMSVLFLEEGGENCGMYMGVKLLEHAMKIVEKYVPEKILRKIETIDMKFCFVPSQRIGIAIFISRRIKEEFIAKQKKLYMCFVDLDKAFDSFENSCEMAMRKKGIPEALVRVVVSLYKGVRTTVKVATHLSEA